MTERLLTAEDVAERLQCSRPYAYRIMRTMRHVAIGRMLRVEPSVMRAWSRPFGPDALVVGPCVYFIRSCSPDAIKIGYSDNVFRRLRQIHGACPSPVSLVAGIPGADTGTEAELHRRFRALRIHGEWFRSEPELLEFIGATK